MEYIQGFVHDSFARTHYYQVNMNFTMVVCDNVRYDKLDNFDKYTYDIDFSKGAIIVVKFFKAREESFVGYTYLEGFYNLGVYTEVNQETIISYNFLINNSEKFGGKLFFDVTKKINRDNKIDLILRNDL